MHSDIFEIIAQKSYSTHNILFEHIICIKFISLIEKATTKIQLINTKLRQLFLIFLFSVFVYIRIYYQLFRDKYGHDNVSRKIISKINIYVIFLLSISRVIIASLIETDE